MSPQADRAAASLIDTSIIDQIQLIWLDFNARWSVLQRHHCLLLADSKGKQSGHRPR